MRARSVRIAATMSFPLPTGTLPDGRIIMRTYHSIATLAVAAGLLASAAPAAAQRAQGRGTVKMLPQRAASPADLGKGQTVRVGVPLKVSRTLPDGRPVNLTVSLDALPSASLRIAAASFQSAGQILTVRIENRGTAPSSEATLMASVLWGADVDKDKLTIKGSGGGSGASEEEITASVLNDAMKKMSLGLNMWATPVKPLTPGEQVVVALDLPDVTEAIAFCGFAGKQAKTDCIDPATESVLSVKLLPTALPGWTKK
jgi:hypothetical protein